MYGCALNGEIQGTLHYGTTCDGDLDNGKTANYPPAPQAQNYSLEYHVFSVEWNSTSISWFVDDNFYEIRVPGDEPAPNGAIIPQTPFYYILNTAISWWTTPPTREISEVFHYIDYVRAYSWVE